MREVRSGEVAGLGTFACAACEYRVSLKGSDEVPICPCCFGTRFVRSSLFTDLATAESEPPAPPEAIDEPWWVDEVRSGLDMPGDYIAHRTVDDNYVGTMVRNTAMRIGRGGTAHVRFDDPTVSRRHALIVRRPNGVYILDDRSLNGVFVNGERVEWHLLHDGDEILIGRHQLRFVTVSAEGKTPTAPRPKFAART